MNPRTNLCARALGPASLAIVLAAGQAFAQQQPAATGTAGTSGSTGSTGATTAHPAGGQTQTAASGTGTTQAAASGPAAAPAHPATAESAANTNCHAEAVAQPTAAQVEQASRMYDQAMAQRAAQDFAGAAASFETANRFAPSRQALSAAIRAHREVHTPEHDARAATLAVELRTLYGSDQRATTLADQTLQDLQAGLTRVVVNCQCCAVRADNRLRSYEFFVEPGTHNIVAEWSEQRSASHQFNAVAGQSETYNVEAPPIPPHTETHAQTTTTTVVDHTPPPPPPSSGISVIIPVAAGIATLISGGILAWSAVDMYGGVNQYNTDAAAAHNYPVGSPQMMTAANELSAGQAAELRTDILIGTTAVLGAVTIGTLILYATGGSSSSEHAPTNASGAPAHARRHPITFSPVTAGATGLAPGMTLQGSF